MQCHLCVWDMFWILILGILLTEPCTTICLFTLKTAWLWTWKHYARQKCWLLFTSRHEVTYQKNSLYVSTAVRTWNLSSWIAVRHYFFPHSKRIEPPLTTKSLIQCYRARSWLFVVQIVRYITLNTECRMDGTYSCCSECVLPTFHFSSPSSV